VVADDDVEETGKDDTHSVGSKESDDDIFDKIAIEVNFFFFLIFFIT
jgi:hypothetical protein